MQKAAVLFLLSSVPALAADPLVEVRTRTEIAGAFSPDAKLRVVNLWATWCVPCVAEMADLQAVDDAFPPREVELLGVSLDDAIPGARTERKALVRKFLAKRNIRFKIAYFIGNTAKIADEYDFDAEIPITFVFDRSGKELMRHQGVINRAEFTQKLRALLRKEKS